jgi:transposase
MATEDYWADALIDRVHTPLGAYFPTLDSVISKDDPVRLIDDVLSECDWSSWDVFYPRKRGQPPIQPKHVAAAILYGLCRGIRSTRKLEEACNYRWDFMWLVEGRHIDHTTFSTFRTRFREPLKGLFKQVCHIAMTLGLIRLCDVAFDATRVKANNSRFQTWTAKTLEQQLQAVDELYDRLMAQLDVADTEESSRGSSCHLPEDLAKVEDRRRRVKQALEQVRAANEARRREGIDPKKNPAQIPMTDSDSRVMPNKEGGYAPNYTPVATTDGESGFVVDCDVLNAVNEGPAAIPSVDRIEETFGQRPENFLTDAGNNSGQIMAGMEQRGVAFYAPVQSTEPQPGTPACREDYTQPVPPSAWADLKRNDQGRLDKSCFKYVPEEDQYYCPQGHPMPFETTKPDKCRGEVVIKRVYRCNACAGCPLASICLSPKCKHGRTISRDQYEETRKRTVARMSSDSGRHRYNQRPRIAETTFGIIKSVFGLRQFLLRGLEKVKTEWRWAVTAFDIMKLARAIGKLRAEIAQLET